MQIHSVLFRSDVVTASHACVVHDDFEMRTNHVRGPLKQTPIFAMQKRQCKDTVLKMVMDAVQG